jgi:flavoprotein hydroxylase
MNPSKKSDPNIRDDYDVLVVGAGPVGLTTAIMLGARGWRVGVAERWPQPYPLPRAVAFQHDAARLPSRR